MRRLVLSLVLSLLALPAAARENYALLIGASTYPNLDEGFWLKGPVNDVALVRTYLLEAAPVPFAPENVIALADGPGDAEAPTHAAIVREMAALAGRVQQGDFVYLHFSGHGSQAPAADPSTEIDGLDETFMPVDIGPWSDEIGAVENALTDDEIGAMLDAIRAKGADIWAVFDSCHSGTATRGAPAPEDTRARQLPGDALGIPEVAAPRAMPDPRAAPPAPVDLHEGSGNLTAFFAAQTVETTIEKNLPRGAEDRRPQGVFTWTIFETLAERPGLTYRQLGQEILRKYAVTRIAKATPLFEGDLDRPVFGMGDAARTDQWPATVKGESLTLRAGRLHGLDTGTRLLILASPADADEAALGTATVTRASTFRAELTPDIPADSLPRGAWLRRADDTIDFSLTVALPPPGTKTAAKVLAAAQLVAEDGLAGPRLHLVGPEDEADLRLAVLPGSPHPDDIWLLPGGGQVSEADLATTASLSTDREPWDLADHMAETFLKIATATNLMKVGAAAARGALGVEADLMRARFDPLAEAVDTASRGPVPTAQVPRMVPDDVVGLKLHNGSDGPVDYNILYVGADWSIAFMGNGRLQPGGTVDDDFVLIENGNFGRDRMLVILTPALPQSEVEDLAFLEQSPVVRARAADTTARDGFAAILDEAGFGATSRGAVSLKRKAAATGPTPEILQFEIDTLPES